MGTIKSGIGFQKFNAQVKGVNANVAKKVVTVTLAFSMDDESMATAEALAFYVGKMPVGVVVTPKQLTMEAAIIQEMNKESA